MKKIIFLLMIVFCATALNAQFTNTKWKGTLMFDTPTDIVFDFKKDTLAVLYATDNSEIEEMTYTATDTSFTVKKIWGQSDCNNDTKGQYHFEIKEGVMYIKTIADDCYSRSMYLNGTKWMKM
jgi:hypothetical protein